jgi:hypothetical protein
LPELLRLLAPLLLLLVAALHSSEDGEADDDHHGNRDHDPDPCSHFCLLPLGSEGQRLTQTMGSAS